MRIAFGCDHRGFPHKAAIVSALEGDGHAILDVGTFSEDPVDYPDFARAVANAVRNKFVDMGLLVCGSGVGASIAANKIRGIRAALVHDEFTARQSRSDDDANVICLGARVNEVERAIALAREFFATPFSSEERHVRRVAKIAELEVVVPRAAERLALPQPAAPAAVPAPQQATPAAALAPTAQQAKASPPAPPPLKEAPPLEAERAAAGRPARLAAAPPPPEQMTVVEDSFRVDPTTLAPVQQALKQLEALEFPDRLWVKDTTLWSDRPDVQTAIKSRLGWLTAPTLMQDHTADLKAFATEVRRLGFSSVLLLGMGGSSLAPEVMSRTFGSKMGFPDLAVLDTTDPLAVKETLARLQLSRTLFVVSSKSGATAEALALYKFFRAQVDAGKPPKAGQNFIAITDPGSPLEKLAKDGHFRRTFLNHPSIGGRFSALSFFGLVPAALLGVDIDRLLERAGEMVSACGDSTPVRENPALLLGAVLAGFAARGRNKVTLALSEKIAAFGSWLEQLLAESTGKDGKGLVPVDSEPLGPPAVYGNDRVFVAITLAGEPPDPPLDALEAAGHPVYRLVLRDPYDLGGEFFRWELATAAAGSLLEMNPFDEPNVGQAKEATQAMLAAFKKSKRLPDWPVDREEDGILLLANQGTKPASVTEGLGQFLAQARPGDYVALLAYLTPERETTEALQSLRTLIRDRLRVATTVGYGPRYLHSTGQLHKGGPRGVLAIQFTGDDKTDVAIPGEGYGFSALKAAQAVGDLETLRKEGRRVIRLHLGGRAPGAIERVAEMVRRAMKK